MVGDYRLIINADDGLYSTNRDKGILDGLKNGNISDVSLIMNGSIALRLTKETSKNGINPLYDYLLEFKIFPGLHVNLTEGSPLLRGCTSIVDENYEMLGKKGLSKKIESDETFNFTEVEQEIELQMLRFISLFDRPPSHVDGHQHVHILPGVNDVFAKILRKYDVIMTRMPIESIPSRMTDDPSVEFLRMVVENSIKSIGVFKKYGLRYGKFIGLSLMSENLTVANIRQALIDVEVKELLQGNMSTIHDYTSSQVNNVVELMVHPGYLPQSNDGSCSASGPDTFSCSIHRIHELQLLQSAAFAEFLSQHKLQLDNYVNVSQLK